MLVQKYGGATLSTPEKIIGLAKSIAELHQQGESLIIVVSAMGKTTDELMRLAYQVSDQPNRRELDMLLTTGERVSMALMSMALTQLGRPAISFTGSQAGVFTDGSHSEAHIKDLKPIRVEEELKKNKIVVLAGFQGVNPVSKEITTLGRGGSDTTAVAMAAHFKAKGCEILKDVAGVYSGDPKLIPHAKVYPRLHYHDLTEMCWWGAKVLHSRSADLAWKLKVPLFIGLATNRKQGSLIEEGETMYEETSILAVNSLGTVEHIQIEAVSSLDAVSELRATCESAGLPVPKILASTYDNGFLRLMIYGEVDLLKSLQNQFKNHSKIKDLNKSVCAVSITGPGVSQSRVIEDSLTTLSAEGLNVLKVLNSSRSLTFVLDTTDEQGACQCLHKKWISLN